MMVPDSCKFQIFGPLLRQFSRYVGIINENQYALTNMFPSMGSSLCICKCFVELCVLGMNAHIRTLCKFILFYI